MTLGLSPVIFGLEREALTVREYALFSKTRPIGYILFARNCITPDQLDALVADIKAIHTDYTPLILIDQEGGRVARLKEPHWVTPPAPKTYADMVENSIDDACVAAQQGSHIIGETLAQHGINVNCAPMCDVRFEHSHNIIGDRAYGMDAQQVITLARAVANGLKSARILPVIKHIPGHGRATLDSHEALPVVTASLEELQIDFAPFKALRDIPLAMTAHIIYTALDDTQPATWSKKVISLIREDIGYTHLIMSDDICMNALSGSYGDRARATLDAGCDIILHCDGCYDDMADVTEAIKDYPLIDVTKLNNIYRWLDT